MNFYQKNRRYYIPVLLVLLSFLIASCDRVIGSFSGSESSPGTIAQGTALPSETPQVAYGSSLEEWEDATQGEGEQTASAEIEEWPFPQDGENAVPTPEPVVLYSSQESETEDTATEAAAAEEATTDEATTDEASNEVATDDLDPSNIGEPFEFDNVVYRQLLWDGLIPADYTAESIMAKYQDELAKFEDGAPGASELYAQMQEEFNNAPINDVLNQVEVRIPGFITPLDYTSEGLITEFLLVPYFGACIHVPPPPANQTVLVTTAEGEGISIEDSYNPIWAMGTIVTEATATELAIAGYNIQDAIIEPYTYGASE